MFELIKTVNFNNYQTPKTKQLALIFLMVLGVNFMSLAQVNTGEKNSLIPPFMLEKNGRDFDKISVHPNNEEWLFTECSNEINKEGECYVLKFNTKTKQFIRYGLPENYLYSYASFSPKGNYIIMSRSPKHDGTEEKMRQSFDNGQIAIMRADGTDFKVIPIPNGHNLSPIMSPDETKITYWRSSSQRPPGSKSRLVDFDMREYDLITKQDALFAGPFHFFEAGNSQYISEDEILISSYGPRKYAQSMGEYQNKFNGSQVYKLKRGAVDVPDPSLVDVEHARSPSIDRAGNIYLDGQRMPRPGSALFRKSLSGEVSLWTLPYLGPHGIRHLTVSPNGEYMLFVYVAEGADFYDKKNAIGQLNTLTGEWLPVNLPPVRSSMLITVKTITN